MRNTELGRFSRNGKYSFPKDFMCSLEFVGLVTENNADWTQITVIEGVPEYTYVSDLCADRFDKNVVYATFDNMKRNDFKPYVYKSADKGKTWIWIYN